MPKRVFWLTVGLSVGAGGTEWARRKARRLRRRFSPPRLASDMAGALRNAGRGVSEAITEGREAMRQREAELRARLERRDGQP